MSTTSQEDYGIDFIPLSSRTRDEGSREKTFMKVISYPQGEPYHNNTTPSMDETGIYYGDSDELISTRSNPISSRGEVSKCQRSGEGDISLPSAIISYAIRTLRAKSPSKPLW